MFTFNLHFLQYLISGAISFHFPKL